MSFEILFNLKVILIFFFRWNWRYGTQLVKNASELWLQAIIEVAKYVFIFLQIYDF